VSRDVLLEQDARGVSSSILDVSQAAIVLR